MARESQGLQIALIIFVMLAVILGVTTFIYHGRYDEGLKAVQDSDKKVAEAQAARTASEADCSELKRMIGLSQKSVSDIKDQFAADMKTYGGNYPEDAQFYSPLIARLWDAVKDKGKQIGDLKSNFQDLDARFQARERNKDAAIATIQKAMEGYGAHVTEVTKTYEDERGQKDAQEALLKETLVKVRTESTGAVNVAAEKLKEQKSHDTALVGEIRELREIKEKMERPNIDNPAGEITWVNQHAATVWINLGRADSLERQTSFTVYSADSSEIGKAVKKATIEVTKVLGDHTSEAKILDDKIADPIMPGDKINTPFWSPGEQRHFALAGFMDIDGDGRNAIGTVSNLITSSGGAVDATLDEKGVRTGTMDAHTQYIVLGTPPNAKSSPELIKQYTQMLSDADRLGVKKMPLADLKTKMGYIKTNTVEQFGPRGGSSTVQQSTPAQKGGTRPAPKKADSPDQ